MPILAVQHVPHSFIGERVLANHMLCQLGQHDRRGLIENRTELAGGTVIRDDLDVGVCHPIGATAGPTPSKLGIDIQHLQLALLEGIDVSRPRDLEAVQLADVHGDTVPRFTDRSAGHPGE